MHWCTKGLDPPRCCWTSHWKPYSQLPVVISRLWHIDAYRMAWYMQTYVSYVSTAVQPHDAHAYLQQLLAKAVHFVSEKGHFVCVRARSPPCHRLLQQSCCTCVQCVPCSWSRYKMTAWNTADLYGLATFNHTDNLVNIFKYYSANVVLWQQVGALRKRARKSGEKWSSSSTFLCKLCSFLAKYVSVCVCVSAISSIQQSLLRWPQKWLSQTSPPWKPFADWWKQSNLQQILVRLPPLKHLPVVVGNFPRIHLKPLQRFLQVEKQIGGLK